jgi:uncharacterized protein YkwD
VRPIHRRLLRRRLALCLSTALLSAGLIGGGLLSPAAASATTNREAALLARIDHAREVHGLAPLHATPSLMAYARKHSAAMASRDFLYHTRDFSVVCCWRLIGENIAYNATVRRVHRAFMGSPGHRANILDPRMRRVGVGIVERNGELWVTEVFTKPS